MEPNITFGDAIEAMKNGHKVTRCEFVKNTYVRLIDPYDNDQYTITEKETMDGTLYPYFVMKTVDSGLVPWVPEDTDMLAEDWIVI